MAPLDLPSSPRPEPTAGAAGRGLDDPAARALAAALRATDPMRAAFDAQVRRFVRAERARERELDAILDTLTGILRVHVEPALPPSRRTALRSAVLWFAVSEYHRAD